jgi:hypothetical protein
LIYPAYRAGCFLTPQLCLGACLFLKNEKILTKRKRKRKRKFKISLENENEKGKEKLMNI